MAMTSNCAVVNDVKGLKAALKRYVCHFKWKITQKKGTNTGTIRVADDELCNTVYTKEYWVKSGLSSASTLSGEEYLRRLTEPGEDARIPLLLDIAPYLQTRLILLSASGEYRKHYAETWSVDPGSDHVDHVEATDEE